MNASSHAIPHEPRSLGTHRSAAPSRPGSWLVKNTRPAHRHTTSPKSKSSRRWRCCAHARRAMASAPNAPPFAPGSTPLPPPQPPGLPIFMPRLRSPPPLPPPNSPAALVVSSTAAMIGGAGLGGLILLLICYVIIAKHIAPVRAAARIRTSFTIRTAGDSVQEQSPSRQRRSSPSSMTKACTAARAESDDTPACGHGLEPPPLVRPPMPPPPVPSRGDTPRSEVVSTSSVALEEPNSTGQHERVWVESPAVVALPIRSGKRRSLVGDMIQKVVTSGRTSVGLVTGNINAMSSERSSINEPVDDSKTRRMQRRKQELFANDTMSDVR